jgi:hypothetical protein
VRGTSLPSGASCPGPCCNPERRRPGCVSPEGRPIGPSAQRLTRSAAPLHRYPTGLYPLPHTINSLISPKNLTRDIAANPPRGCRRSRGEISRGCSHGSARIAETMAIHCRYLADGAGLADLAGSLSGRDPTIAPWTRLPEAHAARAGRGPTPSSADGGPPGRADAPRGLGAGGCSGRCGHGEEGCMSPVRVDELTSEVVSCLSGNPPPACALPRERRHVACCAGSGTTTTLSSAIRWARCCSSTVHSAAGAVGAAEVRGARQSASGRVGRVAQLLPPRRARVGRATGRCQGGHRRSSPLVAREVVYRVRPRLALGNGWGNHHAGSNHRGRNRT